MKNLLFILLCSFHCLVLAQENCKYSVEINSKNLKETGKFKLSIKNIGLKAFKISKEINFCNMYLVNLEYFNEKSKNYEKMKLAHKDVDCFTYRNKNKNLRPNHIYVYDVDIKNDLEVLQHDNFFGIFNDIKYRFKVSFSMESYDKCGEYNNLTTDWIYKN